MWERRLGDLGDCNLFLSDSRLSRAEPNSTSKEFVGNGLATARKSSQILLIANFLYHALKHYNVCETAFSLGFELFKDLN